MPKRQCDKRDGGRTAKRRRRRRQRHLYLVFDDWSRGYSIRKVNLLPSGSGSGGAADEQPQRMPHAFWRFVADRGSPQYLTSAFGPRIVAMHPGAYGVPVQVIDVRARIVMAGPEPNHPCFPFYISVGGDRLLALDLDSSELCRWPPQEQPAAACAADYSDGDGERSSWRRLPAQPFCISEVSSYAVYSDGRTVLVSTRTASGASAGAVATFALDTEAALVWKKHGEWAMPFTGRGHFVRGLNAFVGISKQDPNTLGYLYSCNNVTGADYAAGSGLLCPAPGWKRSKEKVYNNNPDAGERHVGATLVYMGRCRFCLVECVSMDEAGDGDDRVTLELSGGPGGVPQQCAGRYMYRLMTFSLRYDGMGDLRVERYRVCCYNVPSKATTRFVNWDPVAFWL
ncbi:unnamed protein product [Urochloa decumbens]|uniref:Uncharacterized protein n=1 Tax=Urochloa decumbens TaxID=240449 RepID=A0ABC8ZWG7_9POAL